MYPGRTSTAVERGGIIQSQDEHDCEHIRPLIEEGNDERLVHLMFRLLDLPKTHRQRRNILFLLGIRYLTLALIPGQPAIRMRWIWGREAMRYLSQALAEYTRKETL